MKYHFWYKKNNKAAEQEFDCLNAIHAYDQAHEILRGFYASSEGWTVDGKHNFYNSKNELVGILSLMQESCQEKSRNLKKGLVTLGEMFKFQLERGK